MEPNIADSTSLRFKLNFTGNTIAAGKKDIEMPVLSKYLNRFCRTL